MVFNLPDKYFLVAGFASGPTMLNAFDNALLAAGIGNTNLVRMSSILPPGAQLIDPIQGGSKEMPYGSLVPVAYADITSADEGETVSAAIAVGIPEDQTLPGVIMEHHSLGDEEACRRQVISRVEAAFASRDWKLKEIKVTSASGQVQSIGAAFAACVLWN
jgi:arginine decarboxylase